MDQEALVKHFQTKDILAFERLYDMYYCNICGVINSIVKNQSLAEEITQDAFAKAWYDAHDYDPSKGRFFSWILNIARKAALLKLRSKPSENSKKNLSADYLLNLLNDKCSPSPIDANGLKKLAKNIAKKNIQIIDLLYFKGCSEKETAERLGISPKNVLKRNRSGIFQLRENMTFEWT